MKIKILPAFAGQKWKRKHVVTLLNANGDENC